jgi:hypothetical protein
MVVLLGFCNSYSSLNLKFPCLAWVLLGEKLALYALYLCILVRVYIHEQDVGSRA